MGSTASTVLLIQHSLTRNKQTILKVSNSHLININTNTKSVQIKLIGMHVVIFKATINMQELIR